MWRCMIARGGSLGEMPAEMSEARVEVEEVTEEVQVEVEMGIAGWIESAG